MLTLRYLIYAELVTCLDNICENRYLKERMMRLEMLDKNLAEKMKVVSEEKRRSAARVACELAFQICPVDQPVVHESLKQLLSEYKLSIEQVSKLEGLAGVTLCG